ncbi:tetratricopeptide repeat protein [Granulicella cerasi]|uniref:Tetratricopeptide repeat protein n=1 Tax=Granulicella cerasi TaxID=741063 RepID=A0ABW1Z6D2_9BACT|nr:hypothetical protein [Granulicella cerasi]
MPNLRQLVSIALLAAVSCAAHAADLGSAEKLLVHGQLDEALTELNSLPATPAQKLLLCRTHFAAHHIDQAVASCEAAVAAHTSAASVDWLGRAYGLQADHSGPLSGMKLAGKVRSTFERAVDLDPKYHPAVDDLTDFYVAAPGMVGGGTDKANALGHRVEAMLPQSAHRAFGLAAEKDHDYGTAEREFRAAVAVSGDSGAWTDLGFYYGHRKQYDQSFDALQKGVAAAHNSGNSLVDAAQILIEQKRHLDLAERWLRQYLSATAGQTDGQPVPSVHVILGKLLAKRGNKDAARQEYNAALALVANYEPAQKALNSL